MPVGGCLNRGRTESALLEFVCVRVRKSLTRTSRGKSPNAKLPFAPTCVESQDIAFPGQANRNFREKLGKITSQDVWTLLHKLEDASNKV